MNLESLTEPDEDVDSGKSAWEYYKSVYNKDNWYLIGCFDMENPKTYEDHEEINDKPGNKPIRYLCWFKDEETKEIGGYKKILGEKFRFGGDCDFNFNNKKSKEFQKIINRESDHEKKTKYLEKLEKCCSMHYDTMNLSIMPATGAMNNSKQEMGNDRFDTFIYFLDKFYKDEDQTIMRKSTKSNKNCLVNFLKLFKDVYDYCKKIYFIDRDLVEELKNNGNKPINTAEDVNSYMDLALKFWKQKEEKLNGLYDEALKK